MLLTGIEKHDLLACVKHLSKCRHEEFCQQLKQTPSLFGHMIVASGCIDVAELPYSAQLLRKTQSVIAALKKQKPNGVDMEEVIANLLHILDHDCSNKLLVGLCFVVRIIIIIVGCWPLKF
jgi:hypothetical protein